MTGKELRAHYPYLSLRNWLIDTTAVVVVVVAVDVLVVVVAVPQSSRTIF